MKIAPIIHTRMYFCDFNPEFTVRPDDFTSEDIRRASEYVKTATSEVEFLNGGFRWLIADNGKHRIAGVVGHLKNIVSKCSLSEEQIQQSEKMLRDELGRSVYAFIGVVIDKENSSDFSTVTLDYLWKIYLREISPIWGKSFQDTVIKRYEEVPLMSTNIEYSISDCTAIGKMSCYAVDDKKDYNLFCSLMQQGNLSNFSFCSNLGYTAAKKNRFSIITASGEDILRLKKNYDERVRENAERQTISQQSTHQNVNAKKGCLNKILKSVPALLISGIFVWIISKISNLSS